MFFSEKLFIIEYKLKRWDVSPKTKKFDTGGAFFFFKKKGDTITPEKYFRPLTGDPGGSSLVSYDTFCISPCEIECKPLI